MAGAGVFAVAIATLVSPFGQSLLHPSAVTSSIAARPEATSSVGRSPREAAPPPAITAPATTVAQTTPAPGSAPRTPH